MRETLRDYMIAVGATAALIGAAAGIWNAYQFAALNGRVDVLERSHTAHVNAPGLHAGR